MAAGFEATRWIWSGGEFVEWESATVHVMTHALHYGSSVFEGIRCYETPRGPAIFRLGDHLRRFADSARIYRMELGFGEDELGAACRELVRRNELDACYIRPLALRGYGAAGLYPVGSPVEVYLICWPWGTYLGEGALEAGVDVCVSSWQRPRPNTFPVLAKAGGNYLNAQLMKLEARENGYAEAVAVGPDGLVSEGSGQNLFAVRDGVLHTCSVDGTILAGITRASIMQIAAESGIAVREGPLPREMLYVADELFFTGTAAEVTPIRSVDRIPVGDGQPGPLTKRLQSLYLAAVRGRAERDRGWLTYV